MPEATATNREVGPFRSELEALNQVKATLLAMVKEEFGNNQRLVDFVVKRVSGAREVIGRRRRTHLFDGEVRELLPSSKAVERGLPRRVKVKTFDGEEVYVALGVPEEEAYHVTSVSRYRMKCTCWDSIRTSSAADRRLADVVELLDADRAPPQATAFSKYIICKHTVASLARAVYVGQLELNDEELLNTLRLALLGAYLRVEEEPSGELVSRVLSKVGRI
ncbi:MAG: hypothetical protein QW584_01840 [Thermofilaceae archaeon]